MATKHLYECEDVVATLLYAIVMGNPSVAIRAAKELRVSGEDDLLHKALTLVWLLDNPDHPYEKQRAQAVCDKNTEQLLYLLANTETIVAPPLPEKSDAAAPLTSSVSSVCDWSKLPKGWSEAQGSTALRAIQYALRKKYWQHACYLASPFIYGNNYALSSLLKYLGVAQPLIDMLETTVFCPLAERILAHAFATLVAPTHAPYVPEKRLQSIWHAKDTVGKLGRTLTIPASALSMWRVRSKPVARLMGSPQLIAEEDACAYWQSAIQEFEIRVENSDLVLDDDRQEPFYESYFPDDIPDEWSLEERAKSHGLHVDFTAHSEWHPWQTAFLLCWS
jgi:hypothetical protein